MSGQDAKTLQERLDKIQANLKGMKVSDFQTFIQEMQIPSLALGALVGANLNEISKALSEGILKPIIKSVIGLTKGGGFAVPSFKLGSFLEKIIAFVITIGIIYLIMKAFDFPLKKPIMHVYQVDKAF